MDASYFLEKVLKSKLAPIEEREYAKWTKLFLDRHLGKISIQEYTEQVKQWWSSLSSKDETRRLKVELCIARNDIEMLESNLKGFFDLANQFYSFNNKIHISQLDTEMKIQYYLENVTNHGILASKCDSIFRVLIGNQKINGTVDNDLIKEFESLMFRLVDDVEQVFPWIKPIARNFIHSIMLAKCFESQVSFHLNMDCNALKFPIREFDFQSEKHKQKIMSHTDFALESFQIFWDHQFYKNAYNMSLMVLELNEFAKLSNIELNIDLKCFREKVAWLEQKLEIEPAKLWLPVFIEMYKERVYVSRL